MEVIMRVEVESLEGPISGARRSLARAIAIETFSSLREHVSSIRFDVPSTHDRSDIKKCDIVVHLENGGKLACRASGPNVADAIERAAHDMRKTMVNKLGLTLPKRAPSQVDPRSDRRAS
jgi:hypothetical protein